jgi:hypothetical protein
MAGDLEGLGLAVGRGRSDTGLGTSPKAVRGGIEHPNRINEFFHLCDLGGRVKPPRAGGTASFQGPPRPRVAIEGEAPCICPSNLSLPLDAGGRFRACEEPSPFEAADG